MGPKFRTEIEKNQAKETPVSIEAINNILRTNAILSEDNQKSNKNV